ncbi:MAG: hypothetical protein QOH95_2144 [Gaiellaceae bacterium]|nr:hypothetical protein [Gaiellaceae bacterium]
MAKAKRPEPPPAEEPEPAAPPEERASRNGLVFAGAVAAASLAATVLLLSGWTPGPTPAAPPRVTTSAAPAPAATTPAKKVRPRPRKPAPRPKSARALAAELFAGECGFCHTLAAAGATGRAGPNLDKLRPSRARVLDAIAAGGRRTGLMPPGIVTGADAARLATFVAGATRR